MHPQLATPSRGPYTHRELALGPSRNRLGPQDAFAENSPTPAGLGVSRTPTPALDIAGLEAEIDRATEIASSAAVGTLVQIFPGVEREVLELVLEANEGDLGRSIESLLEMSAGN